MKLIDRYVVGSFLRNYLISFCVLLGMYIVLDMIFNFDELVEVNVKQGITGTAAVLNFVQYVVDFYVYKIFLYFVYLSGMIPVVAASFTLMRMVRFNELSALLSAGVPMLRIAMPIIIASLVLNGLLWVDQEMLIPNLIPKLVRRHDYGADAEYFMVTPMRDGKNGKVVASRFYPAETPERMEHFRVIEVDDNDRPVSHTKADRAIWEPAHKRWRLETDLVDPATTKSTVTGGFKDVDLCHPTRPARTETIAYYHSESITPEEIKLARKSSFADLLSTAQINELLKRPESYGREALLRVKHTRGPAQILLNMIVLLLAVSAVMTREPQQLKMAASRCVLLCGMAIATSFGFQQLAEQAPNIPQIADKWPALMAWAPIFLFGPLAIWLLDRMRT